MTSSLAAEDMYRDKGIGDFDIGNCDLGRYLLLGYLDLMHNHQMMVPD